MGYLEFLHLNMNARLVLTDSGGLQEETHGAGDSMHHLAPQYREVHHL
jgi:UDP-N-acetylglucosamine 2-epimerase